MGLFCGKIMGRAAYIDQIGPRAVTTSRFIQRPEDLKDSGLYTSHTGKLNME